MGKIHALRALTLGAVLVGGVGLYLYVSNHLVTAPSGPCDPIPTTTASLLDYSTTLRGGERSIQKLTLAAHSSAMVFLIEQGGMDDVRRSLTSRLAEQSKKIEHPRILKMESYSSKQSMLIERAT